MQVILKKMLISNPVVAFKDESISAVLENKLNKYNHIPVINKEGIYLGIISKLDIYRHLINGNKDIKVAEVLTPFKGVELKERGLSLLEELLELLKGSKYLFIPVVYQDGKLAGIIPNKEILKLFGKSIGFDEPGEIIEVTSLDLVGNLSKLLNVFKELRVNIIAINVLNLEVLNLRKIFVKFEGDTAIKEKILKRLEMYGFKPF
ncbi:CBS domain-containing protein [Anaerobranca californiensis DSM 14826]|uniref:CBS domain-containing protein n=1 Tax=Anaerobranca californiensis DSM 14826 TaxID=1120989 RepID=A0A1M6K980_9FIRM|nr:CBS domain-containing protein [Anaerobranca californiensis]SHJ55531.1 CBS domain-containing protein [Anaerobranca californiensis DSM 14826]